MLIKALVWGLIACLIMFLFALALVRGADKRDQAEEDYYKHAGPE